MSLKLNERYPLRFNNPSTQYPQGSFKNRSAPGAKDGSYLEKDWANDKEGFFQRLLLVAGIQADGEVDTALASQYFSALVAVINQNVTIPDASTTVKGIARLATTTEATTGTSQAIAVTPAGLAARTPAASTTVVGVSRLATTTEATTGTSQSIAVTPAGLAARTPSASVTVVGLSRMATTAEAVAGTSQVLSVTPAGLAERTPDATTAVKGLAQYATVADTRAGTSASLAVTPAALSLQPLESRRIDVPSSAIVDLSLLAPETRHINITGTTNITRFDGSGGKFYVVRFESSLRLETGSGINTQRAEAIQTMPGDTCLIRATSNNTFEVLCYTRASDGLGYSQSWQNVIASRAWNTNYTNTTNSPIAVSVVSQDGGGNLDLRIVVGGVVVSRCFFGAGVSACAFAIVPPGATYQVQRQDTNDTLIVWSELRA